MGTDHREAFEEALTANPEDCETRFVYADWLEEQGDQVAANGQRWQAENRKFPEPPRNPLALGWFGKWNWWDSDSDSIELEETSRLDRIACNRLAGAGIYPTRQAAEADLARVLWELGVVVEFQHRNSR